MKNPYNMYLTGDATELAPEQYELHQILLNWSSEEDISHANQEILESLLSEQEKE